MVHALIKIDENTNRVLNVVKAKYNLRDKGEAIQIVVEKYIEERSFAKFTHGICPDCIRKIYPNLNMEN